MTRRVLIADDEPLARERIALLLRGLSPQLEIREAGNGNDAVDAILGWSPEAVFLDVQMPECDGFQVVTTVGPARMPATVFVTAFDQHAIRAFDVSAVDYLLKPFDDARFASAWARVVERRALRTIRDESQRLATMLTALESGAPPAPGGSWAPRPRWADRLVIKKDQRTYMLPLSGVQWAESSGNYVILHAGTERHELRETLTALEARLDPARFVRIHRRMIVAVDAIRELQPWFGGDQVLILKDGTKLRVSRSYREHVAERLQGVG
jgi:two-component system LytT family response regulator